MWFLLFNYPLPALALFNGPQELLRGDDFGVPDGSVARNELKELPGGSPLSLCPISSSTDLFQIDTIVVDRMPVHMSVFPSRALYIPH